MRHATILHEVCVMDDPAVARAQTILIVEDERILALDIRRTLLGLGYEVPFTVNSGADALLTVKTFRPALVVMDVHLNGPIDGIETARLLRTRVEFALVYVTGGLDEGSRARADLTAPDAWLLKPFSARQLEVAVASALASRAEHD
jgi:CheY-like chemotaxis protein